MSTILLHRLLKLPLCIFLQLSLVSFSPSNSMAEPKVVSTTCHNLSASAPATNTTTATTSSPHGTATLDYDVVVILAAMICALVCALGLNSMLQCGGRCTRRALTEPVGWVARRRMNAGLKKEEVVALPVATYATSPASTSGCAICLADFSDGERIRVLPTCSHRFHVDCIDTWLLSHCSCPTCRRRLSLHSSSDHTLEVVTAS